MAEVVQKAQAAVGVSVVPVSVGTKLATGIKLKETDIQKADVSLDGIPGKIVILGVPGAFSPTCSDQIPSYLKKYEDFTSKGIKAVYVVAVNDLFTVEAWKEKLGGAGKQIRFLADDGGKWSAAVGTAFDASPLFGNYRSHRFAMLVEDGVVKAFTQEADPSKVTTTSADDFLAKL
ncbi:MAG: hypothetical protein CYPHOPRED_002440 [Cyphobasidiales sp. Tagirdzhanova-0007]|nr:MAG: hypothetical protein CYPHOPRED_002440 [Cyphobasidiales sp. Tagirdzhanova-0007]